jgi:hypothetical protein
LWRIGKQHRQVTRTRRASTDYGKSTRASFTAIERYVLREGFPDFPPCPFGQSFSILGFDTAEQEYVWLVTSIIRDPRLIRVPYQGEDVISDE